MPESRFGPGDPVWSPDVRRWGTVDGPTDSPRVVWVVWDGWSEPVPVDTGRLVPEAEVTGVLR